MPHKRNPIKSEQISGLARVLRGNAQAGLEDVALWHERDISHSSVERVDPARLDDPDRLSPAPRDRARAGHDLIDAERMRENLELTHGALFSQRVLLALVEDGDSPATMPTGSSRSWHSAPGTRARRYGACSRDDRAAGPGPRRDLRLRPLHAPRRRDRSTARRDRLSERSPATRRPGRGPAPRVVASIALRDSLADLPLLAKGRSGRCTPRRCTAADGRQRPDLDLRRGPPHADPRQGQRADRALGVLVRHRPANRRQPSGLGDRGCAGRAPAARSSFASSRCSPWSASCAATSPARAGRTTRQWRVSGIELPAGLQESEQLPSPIFTPSTKADVGHDEAIDFDRAASSSVTAT